MRVWWELARRSFSRYATYRAATLGGLVPNVAFGYLRAYVLLAVVAQAGPVGGFDEAAIVTYSFATQALIVPVAMFGGGGASIDLPERIKSGDVVVDLYRPLDLQGYWLAIDLGRAAHGLVTRSLLAFVAGLVAFDLVVPTGAVQMLGSALVVVLAVVVSFAWRYLLALVGFWLVDDRGLATVAGAAVNFFSGFLVPITFFPGWLEGIASALPFAAMVQLPVEVFVGLHDGPGIASVVAQQVAWLLLLGLAGRVVGALAVRKVVVQGGDDRVRAPWSRRPPPARRRARSGHRRLPVPWTPGRTALTVVMVVAGACIFGAIWVVTASATFWTVEGRQAANAVTYDGGGFLTQHPLPLYG